MTRLIALLLGIAGLLVACDGRTRSSSDPVLPATPQKPAAGEPGARFWNWFAAEATRLRAGDAQEAMTAINGQLRDQGLKVSAEVEIADPSWRLVITADGDKSLFPEVERLVAAAPPIGAWTVVAYRQRASVAELSIQMDGRALAIDDVRITAVRADDKLDLRVFLPGFASNDETALRLGFVALDHTVGEKDMETRIGAIDWLPLAEAPADARPLAELPALLDKTFGAGR